MTHKRRKNYSGSIYKKKGVYYAKIPIPGLSGKFKHHCLHTGNRVQAEGKLDSLVRDLLGETEIESKGKLAGAILAAREVRESRIKKVGIPISEMPDRYFADKAAIDIEDSTKKLNSRYFKVFVDWMAKNRRYITDMKDVTREMASDFLNFLAKRTGPASYNNRLTFFKRVWKVLWIDGAFKQNPFEGFPKRTVGESSRRPLEMAEVGRILAAAKTEEERMMMAIQANTGMRSSDAVRLTFSKNISPDCSSVTYIPIKTIRRRKIPITVRWKKEFVPYVIRYKRECGGRDLLFPRMAYLWKKNKLTELIGRRFRAAGVETSERDENRRLTILTGDHAFRYFYVKECLRNHTLNPLVLAHMVGHSTVKMLKHYAEIDDSLTNREPENFPDIMKGLGNEGCFWGSDEKVSSEETEAVVQILKGERMDGESIVDCLNRLIEISKTAETKGAA